MAFRVAFLHALRDAGVSAVSAQNAFAASGPKDFLLDDRAGSLAAFATSEADHYVQVDRGAGSLEAIDRLYIPSGHNFNGADIRVRSDDNASMSSATTLYAAAAAEAGVLDLTLVSSTERYVRVDWPNDSGAWELGELILTRTRTPVHGPAPGWSDFPRSNTLKFPKETGSEAALVLGAQRRFLDMAWEGVSDTDDHDLWEDFVAAVGTSRPFLLDRFDNSNTVLWATQSRDLEMRETLRTPSLIMSYRLQALEHLA